MLIRRALFGLLLLFRGLSLGSMQVEGLTKVLGGVEAYVARLLPFNVSLHGIQSLEPL